SVKRGQELRLLGAEAGRHRAVLGRSRAASTFRALVLASGVATAGLYTAYAASAPNLPDDGSMLLSAPLVAAGLARYAAVAHSRPDRDADEVVLRDPLLVAIVGAFVLASVGLLLRGWGA